MSRYSLENVQYGERYILWYNTPAHLAKSIGAEAMAALKRHTGHRTNVGALEQVIMASKEEQESAVLCVKLATGQDLRFHLFGWGSPEVWVKEPVREPGMLQRLRKKAA